MDTPRFKELTIFDILCLFYGVLLGFYVGICKQCNYGYIKQQGVQYTAQDNGMIIRQSFNNIVQTIKYDRSDLLSWAKYRKLSGFSNVDIKRIKLLNLKQSFRGKRGEKRTKWEFNRSVHHELLCAIPKEKIKSENSKLLTVATANCQLIYNKIEELLATMIEDKIDICAINETWFNESEASKRKLAEVKAILKQEGYIILNIDRLRRGGGIGIIYMQNLQIKQLDGLVQDDWKWAYGN